MARWEGYRPFRNWLQGELDKREWKMVDLARRVSPEDPAKFASTISKWMRGDRQPSPESCRVLADILGADLDYVLELAGHKPARRRNERDEPIESIAAMLRRLPREQVEMIQAAVRSLYDQYTRTRSGSAGQQRPKSGGGKNDDEEPVRLMAAPGLADLFGAMR